MLTTSPDCSPCTYSALKMTEVAPKIRVLFSRTKILIGNCVGCILGIFSQNHPVALTANSLKRCEGKRLLGE
jgi:hypothetical protein